MREKYNKTVYETRHEKQEIILKNMGCKTGPTLLLRL
jgi:hypothetical protein